MKRSFVLPFVVALGAVLGAQQTTPTGSESSPRDIVERVWKLATQGELLSSEGWDKVAREYFLHPVPLPGSKVVLLLPHGDGEILVVSNDWAVLTPTIKGDKATVAVEYYDAG
jgi:hypothetical protein